MLSRFLRPLLLAALILPSLSLRANADDDRPVVNDSGIAPSMPAEGTLPTLWLAGDSTLRSNAPMRGWAQDMDRFFDKTRINVVNRAIGGRSSRTFYTEGRWQQIVDGIKPGDWVIIQFGHNDVGSTGESSKFRGSVKGIGDETEQVKKPDGTVETVQSFGWYLRTMARTAREKGANVVLCSPIPHKDFDSQGRYKPDWQGWREWVETSARMEKATYIDLAEIINRAYAKMSREELDSMFADKRTHTNDKGALFNAKAVISALRALPGAPLDGYLNEAGREIEALK